MKIATSGTNIFAGSYGGVYLSTDYGTSLNPMINGLTELNIYSLAISGSEVFAGTDGGDVFLSTDTCKNWNPLNNGLTNRAVKALAISGANIFAGTNFGGVFLSTDNGLNWNAMNNGLTDTFINSFAISGTNIFAGNGEGIFLSTDTCKSWTSVGQFNGNVLALGVSSTSIFAGTSGSGIWRLPLSDITGINNSSLPSNESLIKVYPNPVNEQLNIRYTKSTNEHVSFYMYDATGRNVYSSAVNQKKINTSKLTDGIYVLKIIGNGIVETKKIIIKH